VCVCVCVCVWFADEGVKLHYKNQPVYARNRASPRNKMC
jgi:hypothetical protein